jgi:hypothetical protein
MSAGRILGLAALCTLCGCSLLLDTNEYREVAEPGEVDIDGSEPAQTLEGATQPVILHGQGFSDKAVVSAVVSLPGGREETVPVPEMLVSGDRTALAVLLEVPVLPGHDAQDDARVRITVTQGSFEASAELALEGLPELTVGLDGEQPVNIGPLEKLYSEITVAGPVTVTGDAPLRLVATRAIRIDRPIDASGQDATPEGPGAGGPGGCAGGAGGVPAVDSGIGQNGGCDLGGGRAGAGAQGIGPASPGGGGGCIADTTSGPVDTAHGEDRCTSELEPLGAPDNRGHGGGGGGAYETAGGGHGGGGGGVVEIAAPFVSFGPNAELSVHGGNGAPGVIFDCTQDRHGGSGGGGSGGVVLLRADTLLYRQEGVISVAGGAGGSSCETSGGPGSDGQVRIDVASTLVNDRPISDPETLVAFFSRNLWRGPRLAETTPRLARSGLVPIEVRGDPRLAYDLQVDSDPPIEILGNQTLELMFEPGFRSVCVAPRVVGSSSPESKHCLTIAVLDP